jgi:hypothetical protein
MTSPLLLGSLVVYVIGGRDVSLPVAPATKEKPVLKCEVRVTGKVDGTLDGIKYTDYAPDIAVVTVTNVSTADVDIGSKWGPNLFLDLRVKDPAGADVKTEPWSSRLAVQSLFKPKPYILKPGDVHRVTVGLLDTVPEEKRGAGTYKVKAVYTHKDKEYASAWVEVKWPGNKK